MKQMHILECMAGASILISEVVKGFLEERDEHSAHFHLGEAERKAKGTKA